MPFKRLFSNFELISDKTPRNFSFFDVYSYAMNSQGLSVLLISMAGTVLRRTGVARDIEDSPSLRIRCPDFRAQRRDRAKPINVRALPMR